MPVVYAFRQPTSIIVACSSLKARGCQFSFAGGWEAPNWFLPRSEWEGKADVVQYGNEMGDYRRPPWHTHVERECKELLENCSVLFWPFAKYRYEAFRTSC